MGLLASASRAVAALLLAAASSSGVAGEPPRSPHLAASNWPTFHRGPHAQASTPLPALAGGIGDVQTSANAPGGTSPWTVLGPVQADGWQPAWGSTRRGVVKHLLRGDTLRQVAFLPLPRRQLDFDWNLMVLADGKVLTTIKRDNALVLVGDAVQGCADCGLAVARRIELPFALGRMTGQFQVGYDGTLFVLMDGNRMAAVEMASGRVLDVASVGFGADDVSFHNAFPVDEAGRIYLASQAGVTALDWDGARLRPSWSAPYDFRGPGCADTGGGRFREILRVARGLPCTGTGTTPTLLGTQADGVVVLVDGHSPQNRLVAFWRGEIPAEWPGLPGLDRRVAGVLALPHSTPDGDGFTAENSPAAWGNAVFIAQWAGFSPDCDAPRGVQRVDWDPAAQALVLRWANPDVHFNGIPTVSAGSGVVLGSGIGDGCGYHYRALDIDTGRIVLDHPLGDTGDYLDQGNQHTIADDGSVLFAAKEGLVRVSPPRR